uniref:Uncharacterized protein n=1 Tax=Eutreptiella gymnastica TaxID=73025 RepID=A0A7S4FW10_9EUGL
MSPCTNLTLAKFTQQVTRPAAHHGISGHFAQAIRFETAVPLAICPDQQATEIRPKDALPRGTMLSALEDPTPQTQRPRCGKTKRPSLGAGWFVTEWTRRTRNLNEPHLLMLLGWSFAARDRSLGVDMRMKVCTAKTIPALVSGGTAQAGAMRPPKKAVCVREMPLQSPPKNSCRDPWSDTHWSGGGGGVWTRGGGV